MQTIANQFAQLLQQHAPEYFPDIKQLRNSIALNDKHLTITLPFAARSIIDEALLRNDIAELISTHELIVEQRLDVPAIKGIHGNKVKNIIAVASGKGGVGKSTTTVNLAIALQREGAKVGIVDADIYGPSLPIMLNTKDAKPAILPNDKMQPIMSHNVQTMSIGYLVDEDAATIWRGPMASRAFQQLYTETQWDELDYLIVDMPPGTGDIQLTLAQQLPVTAAIIVTTPQDLALADAVKGIEMFNKVEVPILGIIENMSFHICQKCGEKTHLFGELGGDKVAAKYGTKVLQHLPLSPAIRNMGDNGEPLPLTSDAERSIAELYQQLASNVSWSVAQLPIATDIPFKQV